MAYGQLKDLLHTVTILAGPNGAFVDDIVRLTGKSRRTAYRLITLAEELGIPVVSEADYTDNRRTRYSLEPDFGRRLPNLTVPDFELTTGEAIALYALRSASDGLHVNSIGSGLQSAFSKLSALLPGDLLDRLERVQTLFLPSSSLRKDYSEKDELIDALIAATLQSETVWIEYHAFSDEQTRRYEIDPLHFFLDQGGIYLFVRTSYYGDIRTLALERIQSVERTQKKFERPVDFDPEQMRSVPFGLISGEPQDVRIRFTKNIARYIREKTWAASQKLSDQNDGGLVLEMNVSGLLEVQRWVQSFGPDAEALQPPELRQAIAQAHREAAELYR